MDLFSPDEKVWMEIVWFSARATGIRMKAAVCVRCELDLGMQRNSINLGACVLVGQTVNSQASKVQSWNNCIVLALGMSHHIP